MTGGAVIDVIRFRCICGIVCVRLYRFVKYNREPLYQLCITLFIHAINKCSIVNVN